MRSVESTIELRRVAIVTFLDLQCVPKGDAARAFVDSCPAACKVIYSAGTPGRPAEHVDVAENFADARQAAAARLEDLETPLLPRSYCYIELDRGVEEFSVAPEELAAYCSARDRAELERRVGPPFADSLSERAAADARHRSDIQLVGAIHGLPIEFVATNLDLLYPEERSVVEAIRLHGRSLDATASRLRLPRDELIALAAEGQRKLSRLSKSLLVVDQDFEKRLAQKLEAGS